MTCRWLGILIAIASLGVTSACLASAHVASLPDGVYLVTESKTDDSVSLPVHGSDDEELVQRKLLMPFEIVSAQAAFYETYGLPNILVTLADSNREPFARLTEDYQHNRLAFVVAGVIVVAPDIFQPVRDGQLQIGMPGGDLESASAIAERLQRAGQH